MASDIIPLIEEDTVLSGQGDQRKGLCPFPDHREKTPSFSVSHSRQLYHCFGCQKSGNIFTYLREQRGMGFGEALRFLARKAGVPLPETWDQKKEEQPLRPLLDLSEKICQIYQRQLREAPAGHPVRAFLERRGFSGEAVKTFRLGYAPKGSLLLKSLKTEAEKRGAASLGLLNESPSGLYDNFRNRLIFPIISPQRADDWLWRAGFGG